MSRLSNMLNVLGDGLGSMYQHQLYVDDRERQDRRMAAVEAMERERLAMTRESHAASMEEREISRPILKAQAQEGTEFLDTADQRARLRALEMEEAERRASQAPELEGLALRQARAQTQGAELNLNLLQAQIAQAQSRDPMKSMEAYTDTLKTIADMEQDIDMLPPEQQESRREQLGLLRARLDVASGLFDPAYLAGPSATEFNEITQQLNYDPDNLTDEQIATVWGTMNYLSSGAVEEGGSGRLGRMWEFTEPARRMSADIQMDVFNWFMGNMREQGVQYDEKKAREKWQDRHRIGPG